MTKIKELLKYTRKNILDLYQAGKSENTKGKQLDVKKSTMDVFIR